MGSHATIKETERQAVANIFNSAIAAAAISAAWEIGLLDELRNHKSVDVNQFSEEHDLDKKSMEGLVTTLAVVDVAKLRQHEAIAGGLLEEAYRNKSLFHWLAIGSAGLFSQMPYVLRNKNRSGNFYQRDPVAIAYACHDINKQHFDPFFWAALDGLDYKFHSVVDLGSGSGERLMQMLDRYPHTTGIGIDIAGPAVEVASVTATERGFIDRLTFTQGDVLQMSYCDEFVQVDLLTCFLMGHDFWPRDNCVATLQRLRKAFPKARRFLLGDTTRLLLDNPHSQYSPSDHNVPIFTLGFEFGHAMMGVYLPTMEEWEGVFADGGWRCVKKHLIDSSYLSVLYELEHLG